MRGQLNREVPLKALFEAPHVAAFAQAISQKQDTLITTTLLRIQPVARDRPLPLSFYQEDAWLLSQSSTVATVHQYNLVYSYRLIGKLDVDALRQSFNTLIQRHEILRTTYTRVNGQASATPALSTVQSIVPEAAIELSLVDLTGQTEAVQSREIERLVEREQRSILDLTKAPALRANVVCLSRESHLLAITIHHISIDGWSLGILLNELTTLYRGFVSQKPISLPSLPIQYADFADWQRRFYTPVILADRQQYWQHLLMTPPARLLLPTDRPRPAVETTRTYSAGNEAVVLSPTFTQALKQLARREHVSLPMLLLAGYTTVLYRYSGCADILLGAPIDRRDRPEIDSLIGYMAGMSLLRFDLSGAPTFDVLIQRVKQTLQMALDKQDITLRQLLRLTEPDWLPTGFPDFQATFNFLPATDIIEKTLPDLTLTPVGMQSPLIFRDLAFRIWEAPADGAGEKLCGHWSYRRDLFEPSTVKQMIADLQTILEAIVTDPTQSIDQIVLRQQHHERVLA